MSEAEDMLKKVEGEMSEVSAAAKENTHGGSSGYSLEIENLAVPEIRTGEAVPEIRTGEAVPKLRGGEAAPGRRSGNAGPERRAAKADKYASKPAKEAGDAAGKDKAAIRYDTLAVPEIHIPHEG